MKYFIELLESYSRLKNRSLILLTEKRGGTREGRFAKERQKGKVNQQGIADAAQAISTFQSANESAKNQKLEYTKKNPWQYKSKFMPEKVVSFFMSNKNVIMFMLGSNPTPIPNDNGRNTQRLQAYLSPENVNKDEKQKESDLQKGENDLSIRKTTEPGDTVDKKFPGLGIGKAFKKIAESLQNLDLFEKMKRFSPFGKSFNKNMTMARMGNFFFGARGESLESALASASIVKINDKGDRVESYQSEGMTDEEKEVIRQTAIKLQEVLAIAEKDPKTITQEDIKKLQDTLKLAGSCREFLKGSKKSFGECRVMIAIDPNSSNVAGMIFNDAQGQLKTLIRVLEEASKESDNDIKFKAKKIDLFVDPNGKAIQNAYSTVLEQTHNLRQLYESCSKGKLPEDYCKKRAELIIKTLSEKMRLMAELAEKRQILREKSIQEGNEHAEFYDPELDQYFEFFQFGEDQKINLSKTLRHLYSVGMQSPRNPLLIVNRGKETGGGKRTDNVEIYNSKEELISSLKKSGWSDKKIQESIEDGTIRFDVESKEAFGGNVEEYELAKKHGVINDKNKLFTVNIGEKFYKTLADGVKAGEVRSSTVDEFHGQSKDPETLERRDAAKRNLQISDEQMRGADKYHQSLTAIDDIISKFETPVETNVNGKTVKVSDPKKIAENVMDQLRKNCNQKDLLNHPHYSAIREAAKSIIDGSESNPDKLLHLLKTASRMEKIHKDMEDKDPKKSETARTYMGTLFFNTGGATDGVELRATATTENESISFRQNRAMRTAVASAVKGDGDWKFRKNQNGETEVYNVKNPKLTMSLSTESRSSGDGYVGNHSVYYSKEFMLHMQEQERQNESVKLLFKYLNKNMTLLTELTKSITKGA